MAVVLVNLPNYLGSAPPRNGLKSSATLAGSQRPIFGSGPVVDSPINRPGLANPLTAFVHVSMIVAASASQAEANEA